MFSDVRQAVAPATAAVQERQGILDSLRKSLGEEHPETFNNFSDLLVSAIQSNPGSARDFVFNMIGTPAAGRDAGNPVATDRMNSRARKVFERGNIGDYEAIAVKGLQKRHEEAAAIYRRHPPAGSQSHCGCRIRGPGKSGVQSVIFDLVIEALER